MSEVSFQRGSTVCLWKYICMLHVCIWLMHVMYLICTLYRGSGSLCQSDAALQKCGGHHCHHEAEATARLGCLQGDPSVLQKRRGSEFPKP